MERSFNKRMKKEARQVFGYDAKTRSCEDDYKVAFVADKMGKYEAYLNMFEFYKKD